MTDPPQAKNRAGDLVATGPENCVAPDVTPLICSTQPGYIRIAHTKREFLSECPTGMCITASNAAGFAAGCCAGFPNLRL
jgi:hypothetical protein